MRSVVAVVLAAAALMGCSMIPYYGQAKAVADTGVATAIADRRAFNDKKLEVNLAALCDTSIGAVNRYPAPDVRQFINRLCGGEAEELSMRRMADLLRTLDQLQAPGS
jgi:hypothetical protein